MSEVLTGQLQRIKWRSPDEGNDFIIGELRTGETIKGNLPEDETVIGLTYHFHGTWKDDKPWQGRKQRSFAFTQAKKTEPATRAGVISYLRKFAPGIGPTLAGKLHDEFGELAVKVLRTDPEAAARLVNGLSIAVAEAASVELQRNAKFESIRIELAELFAGRGFSSEMPERVLKKWGLHAATRIRRDPFCMLTSGMASAGFARCDRLYLDLQKKPWKLRRLMLCIWHQIQSDMEGHTWHDGRRIVMTVRQTASIPAGGMDSVGEDPDRLLRRAVELGVRADWLALRKDPAGLVWLADAAAAKSEQRICEDVTRLLDAGKFELFEDESERAERIEQLAFSRAEDGEDGDNFDDDADRYGELPEFSEAQIETMIRAGKTSGVCQFCRRRLQTAESVKRGYGPVCADRYGLPYGPQELVSI